MANVASIIFKCISANAIDDTITLNTFVDSVRISQIVETCKTVRTSALQFTQGTDNHSQLDNFYNALNADALSLAATFRIYPPNHSSFTIQIQALKYGVAFNAVLNNSNWQVTVIPEVLPEPEFWIDTISVSTATGADKNNTCRFNATFKNWISGIITQSSPITAVYPDASNVGFDYQRYPIPAATVMFDNNGDISVMTLPTVTVWNNPTISLTAESDLSFTAKISITRKYQGDLDTSLLYSIDGINYQTSPNFSDIIAGEYVGYVMDSLGGLWTTDFEVVNLTNQPEPFFDISRLNSIHFSDASIKGKTFWARFEDQKFIGIEFQNYAQDFKNTDARTIQIRASYTNITATLQTYCEKEVITTFPVVKKKDNIQILDKRDCQVLSYGTGYAYIYFPSGAIYEPGTMTVIGSYQLYQDGMCRLETWMKAGITVLLSNSVDYYTVQSVDYLEGIGYAMKVDAILDSGTYWPQCESLYNLENFDIFEFIADFTGLANGRYEIVVNATDADPRYADIEWISEPIEISDCKNTVEVACYTTNRVILDVDPTTGIQHSIRVPGRLFDFAGTGESETFESDNANSVLLKRISSLVFNLETDPIPAYLIDKLNNYAGHDNYYVDGINYCALETSQIESLSKDRNPFIKYTQPVKYNDTGVSMPSTGIITGTASNVLGIGAKRVLGV